MLRENQRLLTRAMRDLDRERAQLEKQEKQVSTLCCESASFKPIMCSISSKSRKWPRKTKWRRCVSWPRIWCEREPRRKSL